MEQCFMNIEHVSNHANYDARQFIDYINTGFYGMITGRKLAKVEVAGNIKQTMTNIYYNCGFIDSPTIDDSILANVVKNLMESQIIYRKEVELAEALGLSEYASKCTVIDAWDRKVKEKFNDVSTIMDIANIIQHIVETNHQFQQFTTIMRGASSLVQNLQGCKSLAEIKSSVEATQSLIKNINKSHHVLSSDNATTVLKLSQAIVSGCGPKALKNGIEESVQHAEMLQLGYSFCIKLYELIWEDLFNQFVDIRDCGIKTEDMLLPLVHTNNPLRSAPQITIFNYENIEGIDKMVLGVLKKELYGVHGMISRSIEHVLRQAEYMSGGNLLLIHSAIDKYSVDTESGWAGWLQTIMLTLEKECRKCHCKSISILLEGVYIIPRVVDVKKTHNNVQIFGASDNVTCYALIIDGEKSAIVQVTKEEAEELLTCKKINLAGSTIAAVTSLGINKVIKESMA